MNKTRVDFLEEYIKYGKMPILIDVLPKDAQEKGAVVIDANCSNKELMGYYDDFKYVTPKWYESLIESNKKHIPVLIIKDINKIPENEQRKFIELFKYRKMYVHKLPENCMIFATYSDLEENPIEEELYSLLVHI